MNLKKELKLIFEAKTVSDLTRSAYTPETGESMKHYLEIKRTFEGKEAKLKELEKKRDEAKEKGLPL